MALSKRILLFYCSWYLFPSGTLFFLFQRKWRLVLTITILGLLGVNSQAQTALKWATILPQADGETFIVEDSHFDSLGNQLLLTGRYAGTNFPATMGPTTSNGTDAFIISMAPDGSQINWAKLLTGNGVDAGKSITTNETGDIFVYGGTTSTDFDINGTTTAYQNILNQAWNTIETDAFLVRFDPTGTTLKYSTYIGDAEDNDINDNPGLVAKGDKVYGMIIVPNSTAGGLISPTYSTPSFDKGVGVFLLNTAVGGSASLEGMAYYHDGYYYAGGLNVAPNGEVFFMGTYGMYDNRTDGIPDVSTPDAILNLAEVTNIALNGENYGYIDYLAKLNANLTSLEYSSFIMPVELTIMYGNLDSYNHYDIEFDEAGNIYLFSNYWIYNDIVAVNYPEGATIHNPFNMDIGPSTTAGGIGAVAKIAANDLSTYEWITVLPSAEFGDAEDLEIDNKGRIHFNTNVYYDDAFPFTPLTTAGATLSSDNDNSSLSNGYYLILNPDGTLSYSTIYQANRNRWSTLTLDKTNCIAYLTHYGAGYPIELSTPSYYDQATGQQVTVYNSAVTNVLGNGILAFHEPNPENTITDFVGGNNTFCVDGLIYQNLQPVVWTAATGVEVDGNDLTKTATDSWSNAGAASVQTLSAGMDGWVERTIAAGLNRAMLGLSDVNTNNSYTTIDYAIYTRNDGAIYVYENGSSRGQFGTYTTGDVLRVERVGTTIQYKRNGTVFYTSTIASSTSLMVDVSIYSQSSGVHDVFINFPNDGPILGNEAGYESGDGTSATHNLPDFYYEGALKSHPDPLAPDFQWQVSRDNGGTWEDIPGANLAVLKPEAETVAGTVQYRRTIVNSCCATLNVSNVATATISGNFNLNITTPSDPVYYCEGTAKNIPITVSGASGNISWQWYNGFAPLTNAEMNPANGTNIAAGSFTAQLPATQNEEGFYRLVVEDASGCKKEASITFAKLSAPAYATGTIAAMCPGTTPSITIGPSAENSLFDYSWTGPSGFTSSLANPTVSTAGDYFLQVKLKTDASFCAAGQTSVTVTAATPHDAALTTIANAEFCQPDDPAAIGLSGSVPIGYVFQWSPGINIDNQQAYNPIFDPGILPFGVTPIAEIEYTFTALRLSDGCIFETTKMVSDTALALANAGSDRATCGDNNTTLGRVETTGLHWQWEAVSTTYPSGLAALVANTDFLIDGVNTNAGTNKFADVQAPAATTDCYDIYYVLRASYVPFPTNCFTTDTVRFTLCPPNVCNPCPEVVADLQGSSGICGGENSLITANSFEGFELEWTTYSVDGVVQPAGTAPRGLFTNNNGTQGVAINATGPHPEELIVNFEDGSWGWPGANIVTYKVSSTGFTGGTTADCSLLVQVFSGQNSTPVIGVLDKSLCVFPAPGTKVGSSGNTSPYTISGVDYTQAPNSAFNWTWTELNGGTSSITAGGGSPFPTITQAASNDYLVMVQDPVTGCTARDTMTINTVSVLADAGADITGVCAGSLVQLGTPEQANHSYTWSPTAGLNFPIGIPNSTTAQPYVTLPAAPSGITYSVTVTESTSGCQATDDLTITTDTDLPTAMSNRSYTNCAGTSRNVFMELVKPGHTYSWTVVSGGGSLTWFNNVTSSRPIVSIPEGTTAGAYVFEITKTKGNCGSTTAQLTLNVVDPPVVDLGPDVTANCSTPYLRLSTTQQANSTYSWTPIEGLYLDAAGTMPYNGGGSTAYFEMYVAAPISDKQYTLTADYLCTATDDIIVSNPTAMEVDAGQDSYYCPSSAPISLGVVSTGVTHNWTATGYNSDPTAIPATPTAGEAATMLTYLNSTSSNVVNFSQSTYTAGVYVYQLTSTDAGGCTFSDEVKVIVRDLASGFAGTSKTTCEGQAVTIGAGSIIAGYSLQWSALSPNTEGYTIDDPTLTNPTVTPVVTTVYQVLATDVATGCTVIEYVTVNVTPNPDIADVSMAVQCAPIGAVDLTAHVPNYGTYFNQVWYQNSVPGTVVATPTSVMPSQTTEYFLIAANAEGCPDTAMITVNVDNPKTPDIIPDISLFCPYDSTINLADYEPTSSNVSYNLEWHTDNTTNSATLISNLNVGVGTYYIFETTPSGCQSASDMLMVQLSNSCDWGDLPDISTATATSDYQTLKSNNGPVHQVIAGLYLGSTVDDENDGQPSNNALGDGEDEDGLSLYADLGLYPNMTFRLPFSYVNTTGSTAHVEAWIDWNANGEFDLGEMVADWEDSISPLPNRLEVTVPTTVPTNSLIGLRIRISNQDNMTPYGLINSGEVEDYLIGIACPQVCLPVQVTVIRN